MLTEARTATPPEPLGDDIAAEWHLDPAITYLNHGCFGARPRAVSEAQSVWRDRYEARPIEFLDRSRDRLLGDAKAATGKLLGMRPDDFGFVTNATGGIATVLRSLQPYTAGDEILTTNHTYNAVRLTIDYLCERFGVVSREVDVPLPIESPAEVVRAIESAITDRTRLVLVDHMTSSTGVRFPVEEIVARCKAADVDVLIDGAHVPGMLDLDIESIGAAYYAGNLHKWVCAPTGTAILWIRPDRQAPIHPLIISHFHGEGVGPEFGWQGTRDITGWLSVPDAIAYFERYGWQRVRAHNHQMVTWANQMLCAAWNVPSATPPDGSMLGSLATVRLPDPFQSDDAVEGLQATLYDRHRIEVPVIPWRDRWWLRVSCQIYNTPDQYERLAEAVLALAEGKET